ncbi:conserved hypothetical protein [Leishmania braziliensis MHOM/BR/75/M2904]|uniref:U-box domain-containing protein n=2 Tax=Leishmania braziliensis TaxID=5660 RepID=A4H755_LEIBR|nr:conserved hypothetical protein [Leishmania braziliensis MHOM/BR/75/M2904]CAJ2468661.1 unnamed protein product [Leishmania braziliensis]CAM45611.2 conserved hypothetical protein [Leishmania braziliensis MHOM/BR/75/M2904]
MSVHPAVQLLCEQSVDAIGLTTVSAVASALGDVSTATDLIQRPEQEKALQDVLKKCVLILNNDAKNFALRLACLECLYALSQPAIPAFRKGLLCNTVNSMNSSVEELLTRTGPNGAENLSSAREMFMVLIFRFTNYHTKVTRLLLQHMCDADVGAMVQMLLRIMVHHCETCEWPLLQAALQSLYELTVPTTYYTTGEDMAAEPSRSSGATTTGSSLQSFTVESFQDKIVVLLTEMRDHRLLEQLLGSLRSSWHESTYHRSPPSLAQGYAESVALGALGRPDVAHTVTSASAEQQMELLNWLSAFTLLCRALENMVEFCRDVKLFREVRARLLGDPSCHDWLASAAVPAVIAAIQVWTSEVGASAPSAAVNDGSAGPFATANTRLILLTSAVTLLRLLRCALYKPVVGVTPALLSSMAYLAAQVQRGEPQLRLQYGGMQVMVLTAECLMNMNAAAVTSPVNLAEMYHRLLSTIAADKTRCTLSNTYSDAGSGLRAAAAPQADALMSVAEWFILCVREEESPFCETDSKNTSRAVLHECFASVETKLQDTAERIADLVALESQLEMMQNLLLLMTLTELLSGLRDGGLEQLTRPGPPGRNTATGAQPKPPIKSGGLPKRSKSGKMKASHHPAAYVCDLTGKLMREPVVLRGGHRFEYDALQNVILQVGHVDPISGESIDEDVEVDIPLQQEIVAYRVKRASKRGSS